MQTQGRQGSNNIEVRPKPSQFQPLYDQVFNPAYTSKQVDQMVPPHVTSNDYGPPVVKVKQ